MDSIDGGVGSALDGEPRRGGDARRASSTTAHLVAVPPALLQRHRRLRDLTEARLEGIREVLVRRLHGVGRDDAQDALGRERFRGGLHLGHAGRPRTRREARGRVAHRV